MRLVAAAIILFTAFVAGAQDSLRNIERVSIFGSDYIRVKEFSEVFDLTPRWTKKDKEFFTTNQTARIFFTADSRKAQLNGINLLLALPIIVRNSVPFISLTDATSTLQPVLTPPRNSSTNRVVTICLDPGHGGKDPGNTDRRNQEKRFTLELAGEIAAQLRRSNLKVILTRTSDRFVELPDRAHFANRNGADLFVSLHFNATSSDAVKGAEVYCLSLPGTSSSNGTAGKSETGTYPGNAQNSRNMVLAYLMQRSLVRALPVEDRGIKRARFEVLREAKMPAILIEGGFMSNPAEAKRIYDDAYRRKMATAIVDGILSYKRTVDGSESVASK